MILIIVIAIIVLIFLAGFSFIGYLVIRDSIRHSGKWGISNKVIECPECGTTMPRIRSPKNIRQALWGGWTCQKCNCEIDKWGCKIKYGSR